MAKKKAKKAVKKTASKRISSTKAEEDIIQELETNNPKTLAIIYLLLNTFFWPGLGSLLSTKAKRGVSQMILFTFGLIIGLVSFSYGFIFLTYLGGIFVIAAWIWALITSIEILSSTNKKRY